jgi:hypothetical protein
LELAQERSKLLFLTEDLADQFVGRNMDVGVWPVRVVGVDVVVVVGDDADRDSPGMVVLDPAPPPFLKQRELFELQRLGLDSDRPASASAG